MKLIYNILAFLLCVLTLGIFDIEIKYSDGSSFTYRSWRRLFWRKTPISEKKPCDICQPPYDHFGKYYIVGDYPNDPGLHVLRRDDAMGGVMIDYCPICGRKLEE